MLSESKLSAVYISNIQYEKSCLDSVRWIYCHICTYYSAGKQCCMWSSAPAVIYNTVQCEFLLFLKKRKKIRLDRTTFWKQQSVYLPQGTRTLGVFVQKNLELRCMWALEVLRGPLFTGWSGHSGAWACREEPHGLAGKTPPTGSGQWTACDHRPDCRTIPLHRPLVRSESVWFSACGTVTEQRS